MRPTSVKPEMLTKAKTYRAGIDIYTCTGSVLFSSNLFNVQLRHNFGSTAQLIEVYNSHSSTLLYPIVVIPFEPKHARLQF